MARKKAAKVWFHERTWSTAIVVASLAGTYILATLAINSGSLLEYITAIALICLAVNRIGHIVLVSIGKAEDGHQ